MFRETKRNEECGCINECNNACRRNFIQSDRLKEHLTQCRTLVSCTRRKNNNIKKKEKESNFEELSYSNAENSLDCDSTHRDESNSVETNSMVAKLLSTTSSQCAIL